MKNLQLLILLLVCFNQSFGQWVEILEKDSRIKKEKSYFFDCIDSNFNLDTIDKIGVLKGNATLDEFTRLPELFKQFRKKSNKIGANAFKIDSSKTIVDTIIVYMSVYHLTDAQMDSNLALYSQNMIYVFGNFSRSQKKGNKILINEQEKILKPFEYLSYKNIINEKVTIGIGGFLGAKMTIKGKEGRMPVFYSSHGVGLGEGSFANSSQAGISISSGSFAIVEKNFGQFLIQVLKEFP